MKKIIFILSLLLSLNTLFSQSIKNKRYNGKTPKFPKIALPQDIQKYSTYVKLTNDRINADIYTNQEFKEYLKLTNLEYDSNFGKLMVSISPTISKFSTSIKNTRDGKLIIVKCGMSVLSAIISTDKVLAKKSFGNHKKPVVQGKQTEFPELSYTIKNSEIDKYLYTDDKNRTKLTSSFVSKIQRDKLNKLLPEIKKFINAQLFLGMKDYKANDFYYIKSKDSNPTLIKYNTSTDLVVEQLTKIETLDQAREFKSKVSDYLQILNKVKSEFNIEDSKEKKIVWTALINEALINAMSMNFDEAEKILFKAKDLSIRQGKVKGLMRLIGDKKKRYNALFDENGIYKDDIVLKYEASSTSEGIKANKDKSLNYIIDEEEGFVIDKKGKKITGEITAKFILKEKNDTSTNDNTQTSTTLLGFGKTNYKFEFNYLNKKGKKKKEKYNVKDEVSFCIKGGKECYEGFKIKGGSSLGVVPFMGSDNKKFSKRLYKNEVVGIYDDISDANTHFIVRLLKEDEGMKLKGNLSRIDFSDKASKFFKKCKKLRKSIKSGTYDNTYDDIKKIVDEYSNCVK